MLRLSGFFVFFIFVFNGCYSQDRSAEFVLTSRWFHPTSLKDSVSTLNAIKKLKPDRLDWTYCEDEKITSQYRKLGVKFSLALNPQIPDSGVYTTKKLRIVNYEGRQFVAPWMKDWKSKNPFWGCVNNDGFYDLFLKKSIKLSELGCYALFVDDSEFNATLKRTGLIGCFCEHCLSKFEKSNSSLISELIGVKSNISFDTLIRGLANSKIKGKKLSGRDLAILDMYTKFQEVSVIQFLVKWKADVRKSYPNMIFLTNNSQGNWNNIYRVFDGGIAEIGAKLVNDKDLDRIYKNSDNLGKSQLLSINDSQSFEKHLFLMRYNFYHKRASLIPWDLFTHELSNRGRLYFSLDVLEKVINNYRKAI